jgi:hypothetical protein
LAPRTETDRSQCGELAAPRVDDRIQGIDGAQRRADRHDGADEVADEVQDGVQLFESVFHDFALTLGFEVQGRIGLDGVANASKSAADCSLTDTEL